MNYKSQRNKKKFSKEESRNTKRFPKDREDTGKFDKGPENDPSWYTFNNTVVNDAASFSYSDPLGYPIKQDLHVGGLSSRFNTVPTLMDIHFTPTLGDTVHGTMAPVNMQCRAIYTKLQSKVSVKLPFCAADLAIHFGAVDSLYILYTFCQRIYGVWKSYMAMDRSMPNVYYRAFKLDPSTMEDDMSMIAFKHELNKIGTDLARFYIPAGLKIFQRHVWMCANIFLDSPSIKAQQYMFVPSGIWEFDDSLEGPQNSIGGRLKYVPLPDFSSSGLKGIIQFFTGLIEKITNNMDVWMLNSYILRAYDDNQVFKIPVIEDNFSIMPVYVPEVLPQIHNLRVVGVLNSATQQYIVQNNNDDVSWTPITVCPYTGCFNQRQDHIIDQPMNDPTPADNLIATRLMVVGQTISAGGENPRCAIKHFGTEIVNYICVRAGVGAGSQIDVTLHTLAIPCGNTQTNALTFDFEVMQGLTMLSHFAWAPMPMLTTDDNTDETYTADAEWIDAMSDFTNYTTIGDDDIRKIHEAAVMGEWFIPDDIMLNVR
nr:MAG: putative capsid protein [Picobirnavirus sp.]